MSNIDFNHPEVYNGGSPSLFIMNFILVSFVAVFDLVQEITPEGIYKWAFRILSVISLLLIIYINYNRAKEFFNKKAP